MVCLWGRTCGMWGWGQDRKAIRLGEPVLSKSEVETCPNLENLNLRLAGVGQLPPCSGPILVNESLPIPTDAWDGDIAWWPDLEFLLMQIKHSSASLPQPMNTHPENTLPILQGLYSPCSQHPLMKRAISLKTVSREDCFSRTHANWDLV